MISSNMNKNGEKTKLLAVIAVFAMVACALVAFAPVSEAADTTDAEATTVYVGGTGASDTADGVDLGTQDHPYATIAGALAGETSATSLIIELQADVGGDGVFLAAGSKNITINFNGYAFNMNGSLVGSTGTESQIMHLEKGNTVTLNGGTIAYAGSATGASMIIQNYSNLTINNMKLDGSKLNNSSMCYTLSINNGIVSITGNTDIIASTTTTS